MLFRHAASSPVYLCLYVYMCMTVCLYVCLCVCVYRSFVSSFLRSQRGVLVRADSPSKLFLRSLSMGVDHGGDRGDTSPRIWSRGTIMQIVPRRFCHISTKMSVLWPSVNAKIRFWPGLRPGLRWGSLRRSPKPPSRLKRGYSSTYLTPLGTNPPSGLAMRPPRIPARSTPMSLRLID